MVAASMSSARAPAPSLVHQLFELLTGHCTAADGGRETFIAKVNAILEASTLDSTKGIDALWQQSWDKPLYADQYAYIASNLIDRLRAMTPCPLDDFRSLPAQAGILSGLKRYTLKYERLLALGAAWERIAATHVATAVQIEHSLKTVPPAQAIQFARQAMGAPGHNNSSDELSLFDEVTAIRGFGQITALHISTDLGYPVYKPDRWLLRFAATDQSVRSAIESRLPAGMTLDRVTQGYLERHLELVMFAIDQLTADFQRTPQPAEIVDLNIGFRRHRFVDLMVVKFGMTPEAQFGIGISGKNRLLLKDDGLALAQRYPHLYAIAKEMEQAIQDRRKARTAKRRAKRPASQ
jgi:hypothetical protein